MPSSRPADWQSAARRRCPGCRLRHRRSRREASWTAASTALAWVKGHHCGLSILAHLAFGPTRKLGTRRSEGSLPGVALAPQPCIRWIRSGPTMMQSCASAARLLGGGPILSLGCEPWEWCGSPPPRIVLALHRVWADECRTCISLFAPAVGSKSLSWRGAKPHRPAPHPWSRSATARSAACAPAPRSWSCEYRPWRLWCAPGTNAPRRCPSGT